MNAASSTASIFTEPGRIDPEKTEEVPIHGGIARRYDSSAD
jgi:hypothetical protein